LHTSTVAHVIVSKFGLGVPHHRLELALADQGVPLDRGMMVRYVEEAGNTLGPTIIHAMWRDGLRDPTAARHLRSGQRGHRASDVVARGSTGSPDAPGWVQLAALAAAIACREFD
jgi:Transposase IS66 family